MFTLHSLFPVFAVFCGSVPLTGLTWCFPVDEDIYDVFTMLFSESTNKKFVYGEIVLNWTRPKKCNETQDQNIKILNLQPVANLGHHGNHTHTCHSLVALF